jgi:H+/Cl- antiporter ClcA
MSEPRRERHEKDEKNRNESWDEKWRRDPIYAATWALILIWAGVALAWSLWQNGGSFDNMATDNNQWWSLILLGAGVIVLLGVVVRLVIPAYRRPVVGSLVWGLILVGAGLGGFTDNWVLILPLILIGAGIAAFAALILRPRE